MPRRMRNPPVANLAIAAMMRDLEVHFEGRVRRGRKEHGIFVLDRATGKRKMTSAY